MNPRRRLLMKGTLAVSTVGVAVSAGLLSPRAVLADYPKQAFNAKKPDEALKSLVGTAEPQSSDKIKLKAPDIAENGAVVPITVEIDLDSVEEIAIVATKNPQPLTSTYQMSKEVLPYISTRIKMAETSDVMAVVKAGGNVYSTKKEVKVTIGGCGG